jgi:hypothetical protein
LERKPGNLHVIYVFRFVPTKQSPTRFDVLIHVLQYVGYLTFLVRIVTFYASTEAVLFNGNISSWDVSNVEEIWNIFDGAVSCRLICFVLLPTNERILTNFQFSHVTPQVSFNGDLSRWDLSSAEDLSYFCTILTYSANSLLPFFVVP